MSLGDEVQIQLVDEVTLPDMGQPVLGSNQDEGRVPPFTRDGRAWKLLPAATACLLGNANARRNTKLMCLCLLALARP
jgi:hypothetical protein